MKDQHEALLDAVADWGRRQRDRLAREVTLMQAGRMKISDRSGDAMIDETNIWIVEYELWMSELDELLHKLDRELEREI